MQRILVQLNLVETVRRPSPYIGGKVCTFTNIKPLFLFLSFIVLKNLIQSNLHVRSPIHVPGRSTKHLMEKNFEKCGNIVIKKLNKLNWEQRNMKQAFLTFNDKFVFIKLNSILFLTFFGFSVLSFLVFKISNSNAENNSWVYL